MIIKSFPKKIKVLSHIWMVYKNGVESWDIVKSKDKSNNGIAPGSILTLEEIVPLAVKIGTYAINGSKTDGADFTLSDINYLLGNKSITHINENMKKSDLVSIIENKVRKALNEADSADWYQVEYYAPIGQHGSGESFYGDTGYNKAVRSAIKLSKRKNNQDLLYVGVNSNTTKFAIIKITSEYLKHIRVNDFKDQDHYKSWLRVANNVLTTGKPQTGKYTDTTNESKLNENKVYILGDKWSADFDYDGMLEMGSTATLDMGLNRLKKLAYSFTDVNYHTIAKPLYKVIDILEDVMGRRVDAERYLKEFNKLCKDELNEINESSIGKKKRLNEVEYLVGGKGDNKTPEEIAKKYNLPLDYIEKQMQVGIEIELEHTGNDMVLAKEIATDHLFEHGHYYVKLVRAGLVDELKALQLFKNLRLNNYSGDGKAAKPKEEKKPEEKKKETKKESVDKLTKLVESIVRKQLKESRDYASSCINKEYLKRVGITDEDIEHISGMYNEIAQHTGDQGSCVLGNGVEINGKIAISAYSQGSIGIERIQGKIIPYLKSRYPNLRISYEWGNMD